MGRHGYDDARCVVLPSGRGRKARNHLGRHAGLSPLPHPLRLAHRPYEEALGPDLDAAEHHCLVRLAVHVEVQPLVRVSQPVDVSYWRIEALGDQRRTVHACEPVRACMYACTYA